LGSYRNTIGRHNPEVLFHFTLKIETERSFEILVFYCNTSRLHNPEDLDFDLDDLQQIPYNSALCIMKLNGIKLGGTVRSH